MRRPLLLSALIAIFLFVLMAGTGLAASTILLGNYSVASLQDNDAAGLAEAFPFSASGSGSAQSISVYVDSGSSASGLAVGVYADNSGHPGSLLASGTTSAPVAGQWNDVTLNSTPTLSSGTSYWLAVLGTGGQLNFRDVNPGTATCSENSGQSNLTSLPSSWTSGATFTTCSLSAYVSDTASSTTTPAPPQPSFTYSPASPVTGQTVHFDAGASSCSDAPCAYTWADDPPSGGSWPLGSGQTLDFTFQFVGTKYVTLTVTDASNASASVEHDVVVTSSTTTSAPANTALSTVSGAATQGQVLTTSNGTWSGSPTGYSYQWQDCDTNGNNCTNISGATSSSYTLTAADVGKTVDVIVTATNAGGSASATSMATAPIASNVPAAPSNTALPTISGSTVQGQALTASNGSWSGSPTTYAYQWRQCDSSGNNCSNISGAASSSYTLASGDVGHTIRIVVTATNPGGSASATSAQTALVPTPPPPTGCSPAASATMTNTVSHLCGFADTTNTGVPSGTTLYRVPQDITGPTAQTGSGWSWTGSYIIVNAGGVLKNVKVSGADISVQGAGATIEDSDLANSDSSGWNIVLRHASNTTIDHNSIHGIDQGNGTSDSNWCGQGILDLYGDSEDLAITNNNIYWCSNPLNNIANGGVIENNYMHDMAISNTGSHYEDIQFEPGSGQLMTVRNNTLFNQDGQTAAIILSNDPSGAENNRLIDHNLLAGGGYCFYGAGGPTEAATNITFTNNHFSRIFAPSCGDFGPVTYWKTGGGNVWSGNVWDDTNQLITGP